MKIFVFLMILILAVIVGCTDNATDPTGQGNGLLKVFLVDSHSSFDSVIIFVKRVEVHKSGGDSTSGWFVINNSLRSFDLLQLRNDPTPIL